eukprot:CAMPEP_0171915770 /NCGR_PEP_ID=MMETSP0993-20121228/14217_1 /TAXON_ID=483369 /ORGANISM="non described non described, Strain CCMP2098" /LENGTH=229 /DNA_ID=CAMNT_0012550933 /DNA_START=389 /DNA_END=1078 /DNA_ORIENTATION=-
MALREQEVAKEEIDTQAESPKVSMASESSHRGAADVSSGDDAGKSAVVDVADLACRGCHRVTFDPLVTTCGHLACAACIRGSGGGGAGGGGDGEATELRCGVAFGSSGATDHWLVAWGRHSVAVWVKTDNKQKAATTPTRTLFSTGSTTDPPNHLGRVEWEEKQPDSSPPSPPYTLHARLDVRFRAPTSLVSASVRAAAVRRGRLAVVCDDGWCFDLDLALLAAATVAT